MSSGISDIQGRIQGTFLNEFGIGMQDVGLVEGRYFDVENEKYINRTDLIRLTTTG